MFVLDPTGTYFQAQLVKAIRSASGQLWQSQTNPLDPTGQYWSIFTSICCHPATANNDSYKINQHPLSTPGGMNCFRESLGLPMTNLWPRIRGREETSSCRKRRKHTPVTNAAQWDFNVNFCFFRPLTSHFRTISDFENNVNRVNTSDW